MQNNEKFDINRLSIQLIDRKSAKQLCERYHYMKTYPMGACINFGIFLDNKIAGVCVLGYSSGTVEKVNKYITIPKEECIEMQRLWISDNAGHNSESYCLSLVMARIKKETKIKVVFTHSGGCKNDCGIVYQSSGWMYFGKTVCKDFYLTTNNEYKNIVAAMRFGRVKSKGKKPQEIGEELFGPGEIINSFRYDYIYPINKGIRRVLGKHSKPYDKTSLHFRKNQEWIS